MGKNTSASGLVNVIQYDDNGNILVIESQNIESNDEISWMVIGERQDKHIKDTSITDSLGRIITEPEVEEQFTCICHQ